MYTPTHPLMFSWSFEGEDPKGVYEFLHSNGSYLRMRDWRKRYKITQEKPKIMFRFKIRDRSYTGAITDIHLVSRVTQYLQEYYGKKLTNCSAFAHFLTTGTFIECEIERKLFVLTQGMCEYRNEPIRVGDMLCVIYARDKLWRSRRVPDRSRYVKAKKKRNGNTEFTHALPPRNKTLSAKEIEKICQNAFVDDYHFLVCVAKDTDGPVWLSQGGRYPPKGKPSPLVFSVGNDDGYRNAVPILTLLKRRR